MPYSAEVPPWFLFYPSTCSMDRLQQEVKLCKAEIWKGKNESSMWRKHAELKSGRNNELEGEMCLSQWERNPAISSIR